MCKEITETGREYTIYILRALRKRMKMKANRLWQLSKKDKKATSVFTRARTWEQAVELLEKDIFILEAGLVKNKQGYKGNVHRIMETHTIQGSGNKHIKGVDKTGETRR